MPRDDITISREWEPVPDHDVPAWEVGRYTAGPERVVITVENASATEDRKATVQAIEDLLLALMQRERAEAEKAREATAKPFQGAINIQDCPCERCSTAREHEQIESWCKTHEKPGNCWCRPGYICGTCDGDKTGRQDPGLLETLRVNVELGEVLGAEEFAEAVQAALVKAFSKGS